MSNLLKVAMIETILSLHQRGWSQRRIARELGIDRETVARYLQSSAATAKPANAPTGSATPTAIQNQPMRPPAQIPFFRPSLQCRRRSRTPVGPAIASRGAPPSRPCSTSVCSARRIHQDLTTEHGFTGSYYSVRRFVRHLEETVELPFRRLECGPGEEAQVDFGSGAPLILPDGKRRRTHVFRIVLSHSRKAYSEAVLAPDHR